MAERINSHGYHPAEVKDQERTRDIEVIMLTGMQDQKLKRQVLDLGAADLLNKPVVKEDLIARIRSALRMKHYHDELRNQNVMLERQLIQSQKMEVVGALAAGVAHDLNNILTAIMGYSDLAALHISDDSSTQEDLDKIQGFCHRAKKIVQQILRFSKKQTAVSLERCNLGDIIDESLELLEASFSNDIRIQWERPDADLNIEADPTQIYQVLMNLCINATQAMEDGGILKISLGEIELDSNSMPTSQERQDGKYLKLVISDTGKGMNENTLSNTRTLISYSENSAKHSFDTSFTTKGNKGSGIGLSVVHRIIRNHGGLIKVESKLGKGTSFSVYFPSVQSNDDFSQKEDRDTDHGQESDSICG
jgi:signal transduction histidine kinase